MAAILGALPLMLGTGTGSELRQPLGIAIVGGLIVSQMLTLFTTPVIYLYFDRLAVRLTGRRPSNPLAPATASPANEHLRAIHRAAGSDDAADHRDRACRPPWLLETAGVAAAASRLPDHLGDRPASGSEPANGRDQRRRAARTASRPDRRRDRDDVAERHRADPHHAAVRRDPRHRRRRARRSGGDQRRPRRPADQPDHQSDLPQDQSGRRADPYPRAHLEDDDTGPDVRRGEQRAGATLVAAQRHRQRHHRRLGAARGARRSQSAGALPLRYRPRRRARSARLGERQQPERHDRPRRPALPDLHQRPGERSLGLYPAGHRLPQRRWGAAVGRRQGAQLRSGRTQYRLVRGRPSGPDHPLPAAGRQHHRDHRQREGRVAAPRSGDAGRHERDRGHRPQHHDPRLTARHRTDPGGGDLPRHGRRLSVSAQFPRDAHSGRRGANLHHRHLRRHVSVRLQPRHPVADGTDHRHRLRRR